MARTTCWTACVTSRVSRKRQSRWAAAGQRAASGGMNCRVVGDHLLGLDPRPLEPAEEPPRIGLVDPALHQAIAEKPIAIGGRRIDREQEGQTVFLHLVDAQDPGGLADDPAPVIPGQRQALGMGRAPEAAMRSVGRTPKSRAGRSATRVKASPSASADSTAFVTTRLV
jgi:hypothetical protein